MSGTALVAETLGPCTSPVNKAVSREHTLRLFEEGTKDRSDVTLDDIVEVVEGMVVAP